MGVVSEKSVLNGLYGGTSITKQGHHYIYVMSPGPKIHKVRSQAPVAVPQGLLFGTPIDCSLTMAEQKFSDFNGSFTDADSVSVKISVKAA
jgi:hypothetical protein